MTIQRQLDRLRLLARLRSEYRALHTRIATLGGETGALREALVRLTRLPFTETGQAVLFAQREITKHSDTDVYNEVYRNEELLYWLHLPEWIIQWAAEAQPSRVVDIGSGYGALAVFAATQTGATVGCLDIDSKRLPSEVVASYGLEVVDGNIEQMDLPWSDIDAVVMTEVLEHFNFNPVPTMLKISTAMKPAGRLFLSTPDAASWGRVEGEGSYRSYRDMPPPDPAASTVDRHIYQFSREELEALLGASGFRIVRYERSPGRWGFHHNVEAQRPG